MGVCGGQSNMARQVKDSYNGDIAISVKGFTFASIAAMGHSNSGYCDKLQRYLLELWTPLEFVPWSSYWPCELQLARHFTFRMGAARCCWVLSRAGPSQLSE